MYKVSYHLQTEESYQTADRLAMILDEYTPNNSIIETGHGWLISWIFEQKPDLEELAGLLSVKAPALKMEQIDQATDWLEEVHDTQAVYESERFVFVNINAERVTSEKMVVKLDSSHAFGNGAHPTTQICVDFLEGLYIEGFVPETALDLGSGSGILSVVCGKLWPEVHVQAIDNEDAAVEATKKTWNQNNLVGSRLTVESEAIDENFSINQPADLICMNILPAILRQSAPAMQKTLAPYGRLILSGFMEDQVDSILKSYYAQGFVAKDLHKQNGWGGAVLMFAEAEKS